MQSSGLFTNLAPAFHLHCSATRMAGMVRERSAHEMLLLSTTANMIRSRPDLGQPLRAIKPNVKLCSIAIQETQMPTSKLT